ncbi:hypothetical protein GCM10025865_33610 (plasmid) [Paraoerskovia sediminicola]|uniref:DUF4913 domain-containing protein n=1 Tax=Paraoerskovia sediminicola TaxID=1138587 RepID=A0ABN6XGT8_9CELL|nr:DUF4913 domain-containing protein [Paraoerskovia sediminicola]BDZ44019.1 hypothetical protein GCM10025865_33180 [Paraoerskovia sediminicola]BDZ44062.1 hypothetical protein GCM10025865_33610 [Paraoerskovia sediminicola]
MSEWGDDYDDLEPTATHLGALGIGVDLAVEKAVQQHVSQAAAAAVKEALSPEMLEALRERAADAAAAALGEDSPAGSDDEAAPRLHFGSVDEFVREHLRHVYKRRIDGRHRCWAGQWWAYDEAVIRLEALWRAWEHLRQDPATGMSVWWRDHADHHMGVLMDPDGPFAAATEGAENTSRKGEPLPYVEPPEGMFPDVRDD